MNGYKWSGKKWVIANFLGWFTGVLLLLILASVFETAGREMQFFMGLSMGAGTGFFQWRVLKHSTGIDKRWIWNAAIGLMVPFLIFDIIKLSGYTIPPFYGMIISIILGSLLTGILQQQLLKKYKANSVLWIPASLLGWMLATATVFSMDYTRYLTNNNLALFFINIILILAGGLVLGIITNIFLTRIFKNHTY